QVAVTTSVADPRTDFECNALGAFNVLEAVRTSKRRPFLIFASTNKVYGGLDDVPVREEACRYAFAGTITGIPETQQLDFHSPYGCSKGAADQYVRDYARIYGLKTVVFRQSCIYGPHQLGVEDQGWVAWFLIAGLFHRPVQIYGNGKQVRDLLCVSDLIRCYERAIDRQDSVSGKVFNLGGGAANTLSLIEFFSLVESAHGLKIRTSPGETRPGDQPIFVSDNSAACRALDWKPEMPVQEGIGRLVAWLRDHQEEIRQFYASPHQATVTRVVSAQIEAQQERTFPVRQAS
ncbi:MAG: GDP-mannose 4,6-dehydratase, partial [Candidatus Peregrinibacteria bacterium]